MGISIYCNECANSLDLADEIICRDCVIRLHKSISEENEYYRIQMRKFEELKELIKGLIADFGKSEAVDSMNQRGYFDIDLIKTIIKSWGLWIMQFEKFLNEEK